jgi:hypothetical protein
MLGVTKWFVVFPASRGQPYECITQVSRFLNAVIATSETRKTTLPAQTKLVRAQLGCQVLTDTDEWADSPSGLADQDIKCRPYGKARMKPFSWKATEGRANPRGIPCLYLATHSHTAMSEVRPWKGGKITLATFEIVKDLTLVDCSKGYDALLKYIGGPEGVNRLYEYIFEGSGPKPHSLEELVRPGNLWVELGSSLALSEEAVEFTAGGVEGALVVFRAIMNERSAILMDHAM